MRNPSSLETDGCIGFYPLFFAGKAKSGELGAALVLHPGRSAPRYSIFTETDGCIGLSSPLTLLARLRGGTRRPGRPPGQPQFSRQTDVFPSFDRGKARSAPQPHRLSRQTDVLVYPSLDTASKAERGNQTTVAAPCNPLSLETDGCIGLSSPLWTLLECREGELDVRAALVLHILSRPVAHRATPSSSGRQTDVLVYPPFDTASKHRGGNRRPQRVQEAHRATHRHLRQTDLLFL
ncbi:unnamed protein product [Acanthosepion pharaonis]|uniref:Uncharacterized protein n=1 Tax=Acanthosepion pharaonis TaxID=158019 RepID=A0A812E9J7_ACAPH|nr:unnamed protein product [Sepia pharaonis]